MSEEDKSNIFQIKNLKHCEEPMEKFFGCLTKNNKNLTQCQVFFEELSGCAETASLIPDEENKLPEPVKALQYYLPRIFTSDMPRERTIIADALAYVAPKIFDPQDDDDDDDN
eukprot:gene9284-11380_t